MAEGWTLNVEREDVCPVVTLPAGADMDGYLATLGKKERHEIRRKVRRAEAAGEIRLDESTDPLADLDAFIDLHQTRWGDDGLFPPTLGGDQSRVFFRRLFELFGPGGPLRLTLPDRRRPADRRRDPLRDRRRRASTTTPASTPMRATCRPGSSWSSGSSAARSSAAGAGWTSCAATSRYKYEWGARRRADPAAARPTQGALA